MIRQRALEDFREQFGAAPEALAVAPGRVNLIGEHTDYNDGFVLPCAIEHGTAVAVARGPQPSQVEAWSADYRERADFSLEAGDTVESEWARYVRGVGLALRERGHPAKAARLAIAGDVPQGAGLSSSASLCVAVGAALAQASGLTLDPTEIALAAQAAENDHVGCACGIMDQLVSARAQAGHALLIDCRTLETRPVPVPEGAAVLIIHSGVRRGLVDSAYNERRRQCETAARALGVPALRDAEMEALERARASLEPVVYRRARHVITENARTLEAAGALAEGDLQRMGALMAASHASLRDDFEVSTPEVDRLVAIVADALGAEGGARMTGGGFGGCVVALAPVDHVPAVEEAVAARYRTPDGDAPRIWRSAPSAGLEVGAPDGSN